MNGATLRYRLEGDSGPVVATMSGGRELMTEGALLNQALIAKGYRVLSHDRRNCGRSDLDFATLGAEETIWADDLLGLLDALDITQCFVIGRSRTSRVAILATIKQPNRFLGLGLWGVSGGPLAARFLKHYYFDQYLDACTKGGMTAVCALGHFKQICKLNPDKREALLTMKTADFCSTISRWRGHFLQDIDSPAIGLSPAVLSAVPVATTLIRQYDNLHPAATSRHVSLQIPVCALIDFAAPSHEKRTAKQDMPEVGAKFAAAFSKPHCY